MSLRCVIRWIPPERNIVCAVYWVIGNLPIKYRSALSSIYLAVLCKSDDLKNFGHDIVLDPLLKDIQVLEKQGVFIQRLGANVKGTVLFVSAAELRSTFSCWFSGII